MAKFEFRNGIYEGEAINNIPNGKGKATFENGTYYEGDFVNGKFHGKGKCHLQGFGFYDGIWNENYFVQGKCIAESDILPGYTAGTIYEGEFERFILNGQGKMTRPNGEIHEGVFKNGKLNGNGALTLSDGTVIEGDFVDGVKKYEYTDEDYENAGGDARFRVV